MPMSDKIKKILKKEKHSFQDLEDLRKHLDEDSDFLLDCPDDVFDALIPKIDENQLQKSKQQFLSELLNRNITKTKTSTNPILHVINILGETVFSSAIPKLGYAGVSQDELQDLVLPRGIFSEESSTFSIKKNREDEQYVDIHLQNLDYDVYLSLQVKVFFEDCETIALTNKDKRNISRPWRIVKKPITKIEIHYQNLESE